MIFLIEAKPEQISPRDQKPGCALFIIARLLSQLRIFWKVSCLSGTAKHPATLTGFQFCKMRTRSWSVKSNLQETFPFYHPLLTAAFSCSPRLPLPGMNSCSRMLRVIAVKLQRACFIKHILLLDFHWCGIILSFQHTRHPFFIHLLSIRQVQGTPHVFVLAIWFSFTDIVLDQILPSTASSSVNLGPKASVAVGLIQPLYSWLYLCMLYSALARI